jgi:hypothetical protein
MRQHINDANAKQLKSITSDHATTIDSTTSARSATTTTHSGQQLKDIEHKVQAKQSFDLPSLIQV